MADEMGLWEERIGGERVYQGKILDLEVDRVRLPSGVETSREVVRHKGAAVVLPLLGRERLRPMIDWWISRPGGFIRAWSLVAVAFGVFLGYAGI